MSAAPNLFTAIDGKAYIVAPVGIVDQTRIDAQRVAQRDRATTGRWREAGTLRYDLRSHPDAFRFSSPRCKERRTRSRA